jgi:hypothetical protein
MLSSIVLLAVILCMNQGFAKEDRQATCYIPWSILKSNGFTQGGNYTATDIHRFIQIMNLDSDTHRTAALQQLIPGMPYKVEFECDVIKQLGTASLIATQQLPYQQDDIITHSTIYINWTFTS